MSQTTLPPVQKPRRWPFYASLFLNVVLITVLAIGAWKIRQFRDAFDGGVIGAWLPRQIERVVPADAAAKVKTIREAHAAEFKPLFEASRTSREAVRAALDTEPFDAAALKAGLASMRAADSALAEATANVVVEIASALSPAERQIVREKAKELRKHPRRPPGPGGHDRGGPDGGGPPPPGAEPPVGIPPGEMPPPPEGPGPGEGEQPIGIPPGEMPEPPPEPPAATPAPTPAVTP